MGKYEAHSSSSFFPFEPLLPPRRNVIVDGESLDFTPLYNIEYVLPVTGEMRS